MPVEQLGYRAYYPLTRPTAIDYNSLISYWSAHSRHCSHPHVLIATKTTNAVAPIDYNNCSIVLYHTQQTLRLSPRALATATTYSVLRLYILVAMVSGVLIMYTSLTSGPTPQVAISAVYMYVCSSKLRDVV